MAKLSEHDAHGAICKYYQESAEKPDRKMQRFQKQPSNLSDFSAGSGHLLPSVQDQGDLAFDGTLRTVELRSNFLVRPTTQVQLGNAAELVRQGTHITLVTIVQ